jgi:HlyD family secretion protein
MFMKYGIPTLAALALGFGIATTMLLKPKEELTQPVGRPAVTTLSGATVAGLGTVEPRSECVAIGCPASGIVTKVFVSPGQIVAAGQPLFAQDDRELRAELELQTRMIELEQAKLEKLRAGTRPEDLPPARHRVAAAKAQLERLRDMKERSEKLLKQDAISMEETQSRRFGVRGAEAELARAEAELARLLAGTWSRDIVVAEQEVARGRAAVNRANVAIERLTVKAPTDGIVLRVNVRPGEFAPSGPTNEPLILLGDRGPLRVRVQVDEEDALRIAPGQNAEGFVRGRVRQRLELRFVRIEPQVKPKQSLSGATTERVDTRVLVVLFEIASSPRPVYVGQQVDVFIQSSPETNAAS